MNRDEIKERLQAMLDKGMSDSLPAELEEALVADSELRTWWEELCEVDESLSMATSRAAFPQGLHDRIMDRVASAPPPGRRARRFPRFWMPVAGIAAAVLVIVAINSGDAPVPAVEPLTRMENVIPRMVVADPLQEPNKMLREAGREFMDSTQAFLTHTRELIPEIKEARADDGGQGAEES